MSKKKRSYTAVFKRNAVKLSEEKDNVAKAARELGIGSQLIHRWKKEQDEYKTRTSLAESTISLSLCTTTSFINL